MGQWKCQWAYKGKCDCWPLVREWMWGNNASLQYTPTYCRKRTWGSGIAKMFGARGQRALWCPAPPHPSLFFIFLFSFSLCLSGPPLALGPLDNVHPCHPLATPLTRGNNVSRQYTTAYWQWRSQPSLSGGAKWKNHPEFCVSFQIFPLFPIFSQFFPSFTAFFPLFHKFFPLFPYFWQIFPCREHSALWLRYCISTTSF